MQNFFIGDYVGVRQCNFDVHLNEKKNQSIEVYVHSGYNHVEHSYS